MHSGHPLGTGLLRKIRSTIGQSNRRACGLLFKKKAPAPRGWGRKMSRGQNGLHCFSLSVESNCDCPHLLDRFVVRADPKGDLSKSELRRGKSN